MRFLAKLNHHIVHTFERMAHAAFFAPLSFEHGLIGHLAMGATSFSLILAIAEIVAEHLEA
jgi:hypothetical protein